MSFPHIAYGFYRHTVYATACFSAFSILMEWLIPGSVTPYVDPIPFAIFALIGFFIDASSREYRRDARLRLIFLIPILLFAGLFLITAFSFYGRSETVAYALGLIAIVLIGVGIAFARDSRS